MKIWPAASSAALALVFAAAPLRAQLPSMADVDHSNTPRAEGPLPDWDVATIKTHPADDRSMMWSMSPDGLRLAGLPLQQLLCSAWNIKPYQLSGLSGWMSNAPFDLTAKVSPDDVPAYKKLSVSQRNEMLQKLLTQRFQLKTHLETKTLPTYDLVVDKSGSKLTPTTASDAPSEEEFKAHPEKYRKGGMTMGPGMYKGSGVPIRGLASQLANILGKPVNDATNLTGLFDINLTFRPENAPDTSDAPSIFSALQDQLGLKLVPSKGPVSILVVDAAQKPEAD